MSSNPSKPVPRRLHKKSRNGCGICKERKVKCDELRPLCGNCARRGLDIESCRFGTFQGPVVSVQAIPSLPHRYFESTTIPQQVDYSPAIISVSQTRRRLEMKLMYHYTTSTWHNLPWSHDIRAKQTWKIDIPQLAFDREIVLSSLLALAASHLHSLTPRDDTLLFAGPYYFDKAIREHRRALSQPGSQSPESTLVTAILISQYTWLLSHGTLEVERYELPLHTYRIGLGIQSLFQKFWLPLKESGYAWFVEQPSITNTTPTACKSKFLEGSLQDLAQLLSCSVSESTSPDEQVVWEEGSKYLVSVCHNLVSEGTQYHVQCALATMPMRLPPKFLQLVAAKDPRALAIMARNYALIGIVDHTWWLHGGKGSRLAELNVRGIGKLMPANWLWAMEWPFGVLSGTLALLD